MIFIGDVHGKISSYKKLLSRHEETIQVGDMGIGFDNNVDDELFKLLETGEGYHCFIRGNHDDPNKVKKFKKSWIYDGYYENDMMFIGGASSIDAGRRTEGVNWWREEEICVSEFYRLTDEYIFSRPKIMVTHECPQSIAESMKPIAKVKSRTRQAFQSMFEFWQPDLWVFGHHHTHFDQKIDGCQFVCLDELETFSI